MLLPHLILLSLAQRPDQCAMLLRHRRFLGAPTDWLRETAKPSAKMSEEARRHL
jgi:hypothetical protein